MAIPYAVALLLQNIERGPTLFIASTKHHVTGPEIPCAGGDFDLTFNMIRDRLRNEVDHAPQALRAEHDLARTLEHFDPLNSFERRDIMCRRL